MRLLKTPTPWMMLLLLMTLTPTSQSYAQDLKNEEVCTTLATIEATINAECGEAAAKAANYDKLRALLTASQQMSDNLSGQLEVMRHVDTERVRLVGENAVLAERLTTWDVVILSTIVGIVAAGGGIVAGLML